MRFLFFVLRLGEDSQTNPAHNIAINNTAGLGFIEFSPTYGEQRNGFDSVGVNSVVLPPPPPAVFLGYTLPPGHPCNSFSLPPPPADKKRTGPRRKSYFTFISIIFIW